LSAEIELCDQICAMVIMVRRAVAGRVWTDFEALMGSLARCGSDFEALEREREAAFAVLTGEDGASGEAGFYALSLRLPAEERKVFTGLYRDLKLKTLKIGIENNALTLYLNEAQGIVADFLAAAFPDRKGKRYTRHGAPLHADMRSMVLDRQF
jgi:hypothetical protein